MLILNQQDCSSLFWCSRRTTIESKIGQGLGVFCWKQRESSMHFFSQLSTKETPGGILYEIFGGGLQLSGPNPDLISDQNV